MEQGMSQILLVTLASLLAAGLVLTGWLFAPSR